MSWSSTRPAALLRSPRCCTRGCSSCARSTLTSSCSATQPMFVRRAGAAAASRSTRRRLLSSDAPPRCRYYIASACDEIFVLPSSIVGSIGVVSPSVGLVELLRKWGVEDRTLTAGLPAATSRTRLPDISHISRRTSNPPHPDSPPTIQTHPRTRLPESPRRRSQLQSRREAVDRRRHLQGGGQPSPRTRPGRGPEERDAARGAARRLQGQGRGRAWLAAEALRGVNLPPSRGRD